MHVHEEKGDSLRWNGPLRTGLQDEAACEWDDWDEFQPVGLQEDFWDAFERDDEMIEREPEPGDFWGELDDEEEVWK